jgi:hypothetical protein
MPFKNRLPPRGAAPRPGSYTVGLLPQGHLLKDQLELVKVAAPEGGSRYTIKPLASELSFDKGLFVFVRAVQLLTSHNKDTIVVRPADPPPSAPAPRARRHAPPPTRRRRRPAAPAGGPCGPLWRRQDRLCAQAAGPHPRLRHAVDGQLQRWQQGHRRQL